MINMELEEKQDLSIYYYIKDLFSSYPFINVTDELPTGELVPPIIAVEPEDITIQPFELGNYEGIRIRYWYINIYAKNVAQRRNMVYRLLKELEKPIPVYNYDEGFPPDVSPTQMGCLKTENLQATFIRLMPELSDRLYYRAVIRFTAYQNETT